jgi:uncharacterized protein (DUF2141 family)
MMHAWHSNTESKNGRVTRGTLLAGGSLAIVALALLPFARASAETEPTSQARLEIQIAGLESDEGVLVVVLLDSAAQYDSEDQFFRAQDDVVIENGAAIVTFDDLPYGRFAVKVFHDENSNGKLDTNLVGFPKESFGFSNDAMGRFGPPSFDQAAFDLEGEELRISISAK